MLASQNYSTSSKDLWLPPTSVIIEAWGVFLRHKDRHQTNRFGCLPGICSLLHSGRQTLQSNFIVDSRTVACAAWIQNTPCTISTGGMQSSVSLISITCRCFIPNQPEGTIWSIDHASSYGRKLQNIGWQLAPICSQPRCWWRWRQFGDEQVTCCSALVGCDSDWAPPPS